MKSTDEKNHWRKVFDSPYLASADIVEPTVLTIRCVTQEIDKTKKTKTIFNTAYFVEKEIRKDEEPKPMILNVTNSRTMKILTGSPFVEDWNNVPVTVYVDNNVRNRGQIVEGLRISTEPPRLQKPELTPTDTAKWGRAVEAYKRYGNLNTVRKHMNVSDENEAAIKKEATQNVD